MPQQFGKGMESLIPKKSEPASLTVPESRKEAVFSIEIEKIKANPYQPRREFDQEALDALAESIRTHGILQPLVVSRIENNATGQTEYQLIAGERRLLAAKMANFSRVPVIIREANPRQKLELSLVENVQRMDLNPLERAEAYKRLQDEFGFHQKGIAKLVGKSREAIANTMRLLSLPEEIRFSIKEGKISEGHARAILMARDSGQQKIVFAKIQKDGLSVRDAERFAQRLQIWTAPKRHIALLGELKTFEQKAKEIFGIENLKFGLEAGRPKLIISFKSKQEINDLLQRLKS